MSDKERLEEIEAKYSILIVSSEENDTEYTEVDVKDLVFLIQNAFKQAKRVDRLETHSYNAHLEILKREQQNKRYREALEEIANSDGWLIEPNPLCTVDEAYGRCVEKAHEALEGK